MTRNVGIYSAELPRFLQQLNLRQKITLVLRLPRRAGNGFLNDTPEPLLHSEMPFIVRTALRHQRIHQRIMIG